MGLLDLMVHGGGDDDVNLNMHVNIGYVSLFQILIWNKPLSDWPEQHLDEHPEWFECWIDAFRCACIVSEFSNSATGGRQNAEIAFKSFCSLSTLITSTTSSSESPIESFPESLNFASSKIYIYESYLISYYKRWIKLVIQLFMVMANQSVLNWNDDRKWSFRVWQIGRSMW